MKGVFISDLIESDGSDKFVRWPNKNVSDALERGKSPSPKWLKFELLKIKFQLCK